MPAISYITQRPLADWRAGLADYAVEICAYVFERFNWSEPNLELCRQVINEMFARKLT
jgi:hypothetical protein